MPRPLTPRPHTPHLHTSCPHMPRPTRPAPYATPTHATPPHATPSRRAPSHATPPEPVSVGCSLRREFKASAAGSGGVPSLSGETTGGAAQLGPLCRRLSAPLCLCSRHACCSNRKQPAPCAPSSYPSTVLGGVSLNPARSAAGSGRTGGSTPAPACGLLGRKALKSLVLGTSLPRLSGAHSPLGWAAPQLSAL